MTANRLSEFLSKGRGGQPLPSAGAGLALGLLLVGACSSGTRSTGPEGHASGGAGQASAPSEVSGADNSGGVNEMGGAPAAAAGTGEAMPPGGQENAGGTNNSGSAGSEHEATGAAGQPGESSPPSGPFTGPDPFPCATDSASAPTWPAVCDPRASWTSGVALPVTANPNASFLGITPDTLTVVWLEPQGSEVDYSIADRMSSADEFGEAQHLTGDSVLALSPDGLRLAVLADDQTALLERERAQRGAPFGALGEGDFATINADAQSKGLSFSGCIFAPDGRSLIYTLGGVDERFPVRVSQRTGSDAWPVGAALEACELEAHGGFGRYPTALSSDGKTLFFYDSWRGVARAAWRETNDGAFTFFRDLGERRAVQPNEACDHVYYSAPEGAAPILVSQLGP